LSYVFISCKCIQPGHPQQIDEPETSIYLEDDGQGHSG